MNEEQTQQPAVGEERPFADRIAEMSRQELERRALTQRDYIERYQKCIDGLGLWGPDGHRLPGDITKAVREAVGRAAAADKGERESHAGPRSSAAPGSASLPWQDVPDRAGWWWWDDGDNDTVMVLVRKDAEGELIANWQIYLNDSQHPCEAHVSRCLGWWAGPVEPPRSQLLGTTPNDRTHGQNPTKPHSDPSL